MHRRVGERSKPSKPPVPDGAAHPYPPLVPRYDLIAIDLDGTLLNDRKLISDQDRQAIFDARDAGITVVICTGRGLAECAHAIERIEQTDPVVVVGGAMLACPVARRAIHRFAIDPPLVHRAVDRLHDLGWPVMVFKDAAETGYDYLFVLGDHEHRIDPATTWWFEQMRLQVRYCRRAHEDEHPHHTLRLGVCGPAEELEPVTADMRALLHDAATMHQFGAVLDPSVSAVPTHILEIFSRDATKWSAVSWLARDRGIDPSRIAAIGDEINDLSMISQAPLGIAMDNAVEEIHAVAKRRTKSNNDSGVAHAIRMILDGKW